MTSSNKDAQAPSPGRRTRVEADQSSVRIKDVRDYGPVQATRLKYNPPLPKVLQAAAAAGRRGFKLLYGAPSSAAGHQQEIQELFPSIYGQPSVQLVAQEESSSSTTAAHSYVVVEEHRSQKQQPQKLIVGVVLSGGQAPGGHNVIAGIFDYLQQHDCENSILYGFKGGPAGIMRCKFVEITEEFLHPYRNQGGFDIIGSGRDKVETPAQFKQAEDTVVKLDLDGLIVVGGDDSNTNAALMGEYFRSKNLKTRVIGCPKTIDGDLKSKQVPTSFGFDTACKIYSELIGNIMVDARSTGKYYHFVRLMGRAASHITLECALQTHPNVAIIGEEIYAQNKTLRQVTNSIADVVCKRAHLGKHHGVILIPEGLIDFIPEIQHLIAELNEILAHSSTACDKTVGAASWKSKLSSSCLSLFDSLPDNIQEQLLLERDPHGNVQVAKIETEKMLISMTERELHARKCEESFKGHFMGQAHFLGYEGRCGMPSNFDANYCYALGFTAAALVHAGQTGLIASIGNLTAPAADWTVGGTPLTALMDVERRQGKNKPVIKKAMVELDGAPFKKFADNRNAWAVEDCYVNPGPIQFSGPTADATNHTLILELQQQVLTQPIAVA